MNIHITGSGSCIPETRVSNGDFDNHLFLDPNGQPLPDPTATVIRKFKDITGIEERRYAPPGQLTSDMAFLAGHQAISSAGIDPETLDYIILAHNFGDVPFGKAQSDAVPSLAARVKHKLGIRNPGCVAYDLLFGCPGWIEGVIQANAFIRAGMAKRCLVIGAESLSRVTDRYDRDSMIYADGAGAAVLEATPEEKGILSHQSASFTYSESGYLFFGGSYNRDGDPGLRYIKMSGRKIYEFALARVPEAMKQCLEKSGAGLEQVKKILIHQANEKMDVAIVDRFYKLFGQEPPLSVMPMSIRTLGNSSVATVPTLYDLLSKGRIENHRIHSGDVLLFASVGAGMNVNALTYRV